MARRPLPLPALAEDTVLAANQAFYDAFAGRDLAAMEALWSRESPVACIHPGWNPLTDRDEIIAAWTAILRNPDAPDVAVDNAIALMLGDTAMVICHERVGGALLACTNVFRLESGLWRMVLHQAGPVGEEPPARDDEVPPPPHRMH